MGAEQREPADARHRAQRELQRNGAGHRLRHHGRSKSGIELDTELYHEIATFRDGVIVRMEYVTSWPAALEAAGVG